MGDIDQNQYQPTSRHEDANETVAQQACAENRDAHVQGSNGVHTVNNRGWTSEEKKRVVQIDREELQKGKNFMKKIKTRWDIEFPEKKRTEQSLVDNARHFVKEGWGDEEQTLTQVIEVHKNIEWSTEMKIRLIQINEEERKEGRGFMKRVKERWDAESECGRTSMQKLRDNAARFKKEPEIKNLILVRKRQEIDRQENELENETDLVVASESTNNEEREQKAGENINEEDKELEQLFIQQLKSLKHSTMFEIEPREKLSKLKMPTELQESADRILDQHMHEVDTIPEITDKVYMGRAIERKKGIVQKEKKDNVKRKLTNGNRRERKLKAQIKELRQRIARANNELYRRRQKRKATKKETNYSNS